MELRAEQKAKKRVTQSAATSGYPGGVLVMTMRRLISLTEKQRQQKVSQLNLNTESRDAARTGIGFRFACLRVNMVSNICV